MKYKIYLQEPLTKDNFFDAMTEQYPNAMRIFCEWVDQYKEAIGWNKIFAANENTMQLHSSKYKLHDLPYAFQVGIIADFLLNYAYEGADDEGESTSIILFNYERDEPINLTIRADFTSWLQWKEAIIVVEQSTES